MEEVYILYIIFIILYIIERRPINILINYIGITIIIAIIIAKYSIERGVEGEYISYILILVQVSALTILFGYIIMLYPDMSNRKKSEDTNLQIQSNHLKHSTHLTDTKDLTETTDITDTTGEKPHTTEWCVAPGERNHTPLSGVWCRRYNPILLTIGIIILLYIGIKKNISIYNIYEQYQSNTNIPTQLTPRSQLELLERIPTETGNYTKKGVIEKIGEELYTDKNTIIKLILLMIILLLGIVSLFYLILPTFS